MPSSLVNAKTLIHFPLAYFVTVMVSPEDVLVVFVAFIYTYPLK